MDLADAVARLRDNTRYQTAFRRAFGRSVDVESVESALVAFQETLVVTESNFDKFYLDGDSGAISESAKRGWELFVTPRAGCGGCHSPQPDYLSGSGIPVFRGPSSHNLGVGYNDGMMQDVGEYVVTKMPEDWGAFKTPTLRNVAITGPYMHDGSLSTLEEVIDFYSDGGIPNPNLDQIMVPRAFSAREKADLVAFMQSLTTTWLSDSAVVRRRLMSLDSMPISPW